MHILSQVKWKKRKKSLKLLGVTENHLHSVLHIERVGGVGPKDQRSQYKLKQLEE